MRWILVTLGSLAAGIASIMVSLVLLLVSIFIYGRYVLGMGSNEAVGWDLVSLFGPNWKMVVIGIPVVIFGIGCSLGFWFFSRRLLR